MRDKAQGGFQEINTKMAEEGQVSNLAGGVGGHTLGGGGGVVWLQGAGVEGGRLLGAALALEWPSRYFLFFLFKERESV